MAKIILRNESTNIFSDISSEQYRIYNFPDKSYVTIVEPQFLSVSASGGHRVIDINQVCHYIPAGWNEIVWEVDEDKPHFVK